MTTLLLGLHLVLAPDPGRETRIILAVGLVGTVIDTYRGGYPGVDWLRPLWITAMWCNFAITLNLGLKWLQGRYLLAAVLSAVAGPANYLAGARMGAIQLNAGLPVSIVVLVVVWLAERVRG